MSLLGSAFTIISCLIGAGDLYIGIMALPSGFMHAGIILGVLILLGVGLISYMGVIFMTTAAERYKLYIYVDLVDRILGSVIFT